MHDQQRNRVARAVAGDRDALVGLLEEHGPRVESRLVISPVWRGLVDAADVMQVTYMEAFTQVSQFDPARPRAFPAWLRRMAEHNLRDAIRGLEARKKPSPRRQVDAHGTDGAVALFDVLTAGVGTPSRLARSAEAVERLREALRCLPQTYATVVQLYDLEGRPVAAVAAAVGRSVGAVYMLRMRALDRLRLLLGSPSGILDSRS